jgi:Zn ribbon nucleic-acid-binding protein
MTPADGTYADQLDPCPFCKSKNLLYCGSGDGYKHIDCMDCGGRGPLARTWQWTKKKWNNRPSLRRPAE